MRISQKVRVQKCTGDCPLCSLEAEDIFGVGPEDEAVFFVGQVQVQEVTDLRGWEPHGVIRAEEDSVDTPAADQIPAFVRAQPIEGGGCIHEDVLEAGEQAEGIIPDAPAAQMGADELQAGKRAEDGKNPVWIGIVEAVIPGMYQHRKAGILAELIDGHGLGRVGLKTLDIRMELDAVQAQGEQFAEILLQVI